MFSERICVNWYYFFLKCFMVFASEPSGPGIYFVRRAFIKNLISLGDIGLFIFSISPVSLAKFFFYKESFISSKMLNVLKP